MITVQFGICGVDRRVVDKRQYFQNKIDVECELLNSCSVENPVLVLSYNANIVNYNYAYIVEWNRFYYVNHPELTPGQRMIVPLSEDVLTSNAQEILALNCNIIRQENAGLTMFPDDRIGTNCGYYISQYLFSNQPLSTVNTNSNTYVISIIGG